LMFISKVYLDPFLHFHCSHDHVLLIKACELNLHHSQTWENSASPSLSVHRSCLLQSFESCELPFKVIPQIHSHHFHILVCFSHQTLYYNR
jgi:hypothetical protein